MAIDCCFTLMRLADLRPHAPCKPCAAGQPAAPQAVQIASAGEDKLTVTWNAPTTDNTASSYAVRLYSSTAAFAGAQAANWTGLAWDNQPPPSQGSLTIPGGGQNGYSFTTPPLTLPLGKLFPEEPAMKLCRSADSSVLWAQELAARFSDSRYCEPTLLHSLPPRTAAQSAHAASPSLPPALQVSTRRRSWLCPVSILPSPPTVILTRHLWATQG